MNNKNWSDQSTHDPAREFTEKFNYHDSETDLQKVEEFILDNNYSKLSEEDKSMANDFLLYCLEKYWTLYPESMAKYKWTFLWYKFFWGEVGDKNYNTLQRKCEAQNKPMIEEELISEFDFISDTVKWALTLDNAGLDDQTDQVINNINVLLEESLQRQRQ